MISVVRGEIKMFKGETMNVHTGARRPKQMVHPPMLDRVRQRAVFAHGPQTRMGKSRDTAKPAATPHGMMLMGRSWLQRRSQSLE
jgi:hypothetical protein